MFAFLNQIFGILVATTNYAIAFVSTVFNISHAIGYFIVKYLILGFSILSNAFSFISSGLNVLYEDFCIFFIDFKNKITDISILLSTSATAILSTIQYLVFGVKSSILYVCETFINFVCFIVDGIAKSFGLVIDFAELFKWTIILIGRGFWIAIQLIPLCLLYLAYSIFSLIVYLITRTYEHISDGVSFIFDKTTQAGQWTASYLFDFPLEALFGLVLGTTLTYLYSKYQDRIINSIVRSVKRTVRLIRTALMCVWLVVVHRLQSWRRTIAAPPMDSDSDSTQDEEPPLRRSTRLQARFGKTSAKDNPALLRRQLEQEQEEKLCVVCQDQNKCSIVMPCRHLCLCADCSQIIQRTTGTCPICRQDLERILTVYM